MGVVLMERRGAASERILGVFVRSLVCLVVIEISVF